jgi:hypothetical protein
MQTFFGAQRYLPLLLFSEVCKECRYYGRHEGLEENYYNRLVPGAPISSTNKTDRHDIAEILFKVALNTIALTSNPKLPV